MSTFCFEDHKLKNCSKNSFLNPRIKSRFTLSLKNGIFKINTHDPLLSKSLPQQLKQ